MAGDRFHFHYNDILPTKPAVVVTDDEQVKVCRRCGAEYTTRSRISHHCPACRPIAKQAQSLKGQQRRRARLKADRQAR